MKNVFDLLNDRIIVRLTRGFSKRLSLGCCYDAIPWDRPIFVMSFDIDFRRDVTSLGRVVDRLASYSIPAVFACTGELVKRYPGEHKILVDAGHELMNHSMNHPDNEELEARHWNDLSLQRQRDEISMAHDEISTLVGRPPKGFRTPHFGPQHRRHIYDILNDLGYVYSSSTTCGGDYGYCRPLRVKDMNLLELPTATIPGMGYASFDSFNYFNRPKPLCRDGRNMPDDFRAMLTVIIEKRLLGTVYFDPHDFAERNEYLEILKILDSSRDKIELITYSGALNIRDC